jgi:acyl-CoA thioesterase-2
VTPQFPRPADVAVLGIQFDESLDRSRFEVTPRLARHDGGLYGGSAVAASVAAMEAVSGRPALWVTTQYVSTARPKAVVECTAEVLANGRNISQVQVQGRTEGQLLFMSVGSTAFPREDGIEGQFQTMPSMMGPEDSPVMSFGPPSDSGFRGFIEQVEYRVASALEDEPSPPALAMWVRFVDRHPFTPAGISFVADMVPGAIARVVGMVGGGTSLDNSLRFGRIDGKHEWVLLDLRAHMAAGAHAHGSVCVWSVSGELLAVGGQSTNMTHMMPVAEWEKWAAGGAKSGA